MLWVRNLLTDLAAEGRTVLLSSPLMSETSPIANHLVVIGRGRLLADTSVAELIVQVGGSGIKVASTEAPRLRSILTAPGVSVTGIAEELLVSGLSAHEIGELANRNGVPLYQLSNQSVSLEDAFMELTCDDVEYHSAAVATLQEVVR